MGLRTIEQELQAERQMRIAVEREYSELKEKYDILLVTTNNTKSNPDADYIRNEHLRTYRL
jgi:hypothetical protein